MRTVLITGTSSGIGLATSVELAKRGWSVVATMRDLTKRGELDRQLQSAGVSDRVRVDAVGRDRQPVDRCARRGPRPSQPAARCRCPQCRHRGRRRLRRSGRRAVPPRHGDQFLRRAGTHAAVVAGVSRAAAWAHRRSFPAKLRSPVSRLFRLTALRNGRPRDGRNRSRMNSSRSTFRSVSSSRGRRARTSGRARRGSFRRKAFTGR